MQLGATASCTKRIMETTKGIDQRDRKGATKDFFFLEIGSPQRIRQKLQYMLAQT